jgi:hypothetical protein
MQGTGPQICLDSDVTKRSREQTVKPQILLQHHTQRIILEKSNFLNFMLWYVLYCKNGRMS